MGSGLHGFLSLCLITHANEYANANEGELLQVGDGLVSGGASSEGWLTVKSPHLH